VTSGLSDSHGNLDEDEVVEPMPMRVAEVEAAIAGGTINDGRSVVIFCRVNGRTHLDKTAPSI
jgi:hypothetical protein